MKNNHGEILASVVVPTYNRQKLLSYVLETLTRQSIPTQSFEVIVIDDGSKDDTRAVVDGFIDRLNIKYFYQDDQGYRPATARNLGIQNASADIVIFLDSDILLGTRGIEEHIKTHAAHEEHVAVIGYIYGVENNVEQMARLESLIQVDDIDATIQYLQTQKLNLDFREEVFQKYKFQIESLPAPWIFFWSGHVSFDKRCFKKDEMLFNEAYNFNWGCEDVDFGYRLHKKGVKMLVNRKIESIHYPHKKYENHKDAQRINLQKFEEIHNTTESRLLGKLIRNGIHDIYFNEYLIAEKKQLA